jgi:hypothetical protein
MLKTNLLLVKTGGEESQKLTKRGRESLEQFYISSRELHLHGWMEKTW